MRSILLLVFHGFVQIRATVVSFTSKERFELFFKLCNGLGISNGHTQPSTHQKANSLLVICHSQQHREVPH